MRRNVDGNSIWGIADCSRPGSEAKPNGQKKLGRPSRRRALSETRNFQRLRESLLHAGHSRRKSEMTSLLHWIPFPRNSRPVEADPSIGGMPRIRTSDLCQQYVNSNSRESLGFRPVDDRRDRLRFRGGT